MAHVPQKPARTYGDGRTGAPGARRSARRQIAQTSELLRARGVTQTPARIYANLLLFRILCDAVADGDTATIGLKERDILARLAADVDALLDPRRAKPRMARAKSRGGNG